MAGAAVDPDAFEADLGALGFRFMQEGRGGVRQYALLVSPYLTYWVHWDVAGAAVLFTWEHAIGEYVNSIDLQVGANEPLNQFLFPKYDARGAQDIAFVVSEMDRVEAILRGINLLAD
jgi:hypothetical protein